MGRKRTEFSPETDDRIRALRARGGTCDSICADLNASGVKGVSRATIGRRIQQLCGVGPRSSRPPPPASTGFAAGLAEAGGVPGTAPPPPESAGGLPESEEDIEAADPGTLDVWLARAEAAGRAAAAQGNLPAIGQMGRLAVTLQEAKRKAMPIPKADPNEHPDFVKLGAEVEARFLKMIDLVLEGS